MGCGYGDLKEFLDQRFSDFAYLGIDQMHEFIVQAEERYQGSSNTHFIETDFSAVQLPRMDYVLASGALAYRSDDPGFHMNMVRKMYESAVHALAFNMLDVDRFPKHPLLTGHNREEVVAQCQDLCGNVEVIRGYLDDDFTVFMRRP